MSFQTIFSPPNKLESKTPTKTTFSKLKLKTKLKTVINSYHTDNNK